MSNEHAAFGILTSHEYAYLMLADTVNIYILCMHMYDVLASMMHMYDYNFET